MTERLFGRASKSWAWFATLALTATALLVGTSLTQAQQPNVDQELQLFNNLPPAQQQAILQQLGIGGLGSGLGGGSLNGGLGALLGLGGQLGNGTQNGSQAVQLQQQLLQLQRRQQARGEPEETVPRFKPGDTVLVDINMPEAPAAPTYPASPAQLGNVQTFGTSSAGSQTSNINNGSGAPLSSSQLSQLSQLASQSGVNLTPTPGAQMSSESSQPMSEQLQAGEGERLQDLVDLIRVHNPYRLDGIGQLLLPGIPAIAIAGLTEDLATRRVSAEPALAHLRIKLTKLPLQKSGLEALKPFGYDLFENSMVSFLPQLNIPVPGDYIVGAGDVLQVQLYGNMNQNLSLVVNRDGQVDFPQLGPIHVGGQPYSQVKGEIEAGVARQMLGEHANVSLGETRTINVFVLGAAKFPGSYTLSGLATVTTALFAAGGVQITGSLRAIRVERQGRTIRVLDLYDLLMRGDSSNDVKLLPGDVVFIPSLGPTVSLDGQVLRPAIYELKGNESVVDLIQMGGGLTPDADRNSAALVRIDAQLRRTVVDVDPSSRSLPVLQLRNGDALEVPRLLPQLVSGVTLQGYVYRPRYFAWQRGLRLADLIPSLDELKPNADQHYLLIRRELPDHRIQVFSADLGAALAAPGSASDIQLMPRDTVTVFDLENSRQYVIQPLMSELRLQSNLSAPTEIVHIDGRVKVPGDYPLEPGMRISDLLRAGGGLAPSAYSARAELSRYTVANGAQRRTDVLSIDLNKVRDGDASANLALQPFDRLSIKQISGWTDVAQVTLLGEVRFPGIYPIKRGETLRSVIERAGGLTDLSFPQGAVFTRVELKREEQAQLDRLAEHMRTDIAEMALMGTRAGLGGSEAAIGIGQTLLSQLQSAKAVGRLVINLEAVMHARPGSSNDVLLEDGDELIVPRVEQQVMVLGEVQDATSHLYHPGLTRDDYINQSGGITTQAAPKQIYVVRADGSVVTGNRGWFQAGGSVRIQAGDAIVVPLNTEKLPALTIWQQSSSILYNLAIAAVALHSF